MSRFYDALRQASRLHANADASHTPKSPAGVGDYLRSLHPRPLPTTEEGSSVSTAELPLVDPPRLTFQPVSEHPEAVTKLGTDADLDIDVTARVIPNISDHVVVEHYRRLRTKLLQQQATRSFRSLLITSPSPQEGKTVTSLNLALSFSMLPSFRVAVVDGDLRRGSLGQWLGLTGRPGLSNFIEGTATLEEVVFTSKEIPVNFIASGTSGIAPAELLQSPQFHSQFRRMTERFDLVVVDSPPVNIITDAQLLAASCDAVLMVARAFSTTCKSFEKAVQDLGSFPILGTVLNGGTRTRVYKSYNGYY